MHAWLCENPTGVEALAWKELPTPEPKAGEVRVELTFQPKSGGKTKENHVLVVVRKGDSWLIDSDSQV